MSERDAGGPYGIGVVVSTLQDEFPQMEVTVSKVRFLESSGIVTPARTPSGYRKFDADDVERLRYTLRMQRDHFLPLKKIREYLDQLDRGFEPPPPQEPAPRVPSATTDDVVAAPRLTGFAKGATLSERDLAEQSGLSARTVTELRKQKVIQPEIGTDQYSVASLEIARAVARLEDQGIEARNLKLAVFNAAERQVDLIESLIVPAKVSVANESARSDLQERVQNLALLLLSLQSASLQARLSREYGDSGVVGA